MALVTPNRQVFQRPTPTRRLPGGWQTGDPAAIARRYSGNAGALRSNLGIAPAQPASRATQSNSIAPMGGSYYDSRKPGRVYKEDGTLDFEGTVKDGDRWGEAMSGFNGGSSETTSRPASGVQSPPGNATQRWSQTKEDWIAAGGTSRTFNKANTERGVRPRIDGRATPDPKGSTASAEIRQKWGWPETTSNLPY